MSKVKTQMKKLMSDEESSGINGMFEEMMGMRDAELHIILPKIVSARNNIKKVYQYLYQFSTFAPLINTFDTMTSSFKQILTFVEEMKQSIVFEDAKIETASMYDFDQEKANVIYKSIKENKYTKSLIILGGRLKRFEPALKELKDSFIMQEPGVSLFIFNFSSLDLKKMWASSKMTPMIKKYILTVLLKIYEEVNALYSTVSSPDVDINEFSIKLVKCIKSLQSIPQLNRCKNAFRKIEDSINLLKDRFSGYYRESMACNNPNIIVENFILDVSNQPGTNAKLTREFRVIIQYMHKESVKNGRNKDPNIQKLFNILNQKMNINDNKEDDLTVDNTANNTNEDADNTANDNAVNVDNVADNTNEDVDNVADNTNEDVDKFNNEDNNQTDTDPVMDELVNNFNTQLGREIER